MKKIKNNLLINVLEDTTMVKLNFNKKSISVTVRVKKTQKTFTIYKAK